jgi:hypothetical protein
MYGYVKTIVRKQSHCIYSHSTHESSRAQHTSRSFGCGRDCIETYTRARHRTEKADCLVLLTRQKEMQMRNSNCENESMGTGRMREKNRHNTSLAQTLSENQQSSVLRASGKTVDSKGYKELTVAVTTAPRKDCTLAYCLASIESCGWNPIVFAEPGSTETDYKTVWNDTRKGIWHNWLSSCRWCLENTSTDFILTVQDDSLFHPDSKFLVDAIDWPENCGFVSLYTPKHYSVRRDGTLRSPGINKIITRSLWGACALVWNRETLARVLDTPTCKHWLGAKPKSGSASVVQNRKNNPSLVANSDTAIGKAINRLGLFMYFVDPSPVHHISQYSTISHGDNTGRRNCYRCADFDKPLISQVFG